MLRHTRLALIVLAALTAATAWTAEDAPGLRVAPFDIDVTPPLGYHMAYDPVVGTWDLGLRARGIVLLGAGEPIVLCAIDWIGIGNAAYDAFREGLAEAAGTVPDWVAVHTLHQHDAPACDFSAETTLAEHGLDLLRYDGEFARESLDRLKAAVREALGNAVPVTHVGTGAATVEQVASNRRILGGDGQVRAMRFTACGDPALRAEPEGTIDPELSMISLWNGGGPVAVLTYYACHPQSYYRTGIPNPDFPGVARFLRQMAVPAALHVHFTGAAGNIGAGKYNDGSRENRLALAERLADAMRRAWKATERTPLRAEDVAWRVAPAALPVAAHLTVESLEAEIARAGADGGAGDLARKLAWVRRCADGYRAPLTCLALGDARILHMPGELFVEYQIAAKAMRPDRFVAMAAYGDYAMGYIGTKEAYGQGGYETSERASNVAPEVEDVLMAGIRGLLEP